MSNNLSRKGKKGKSRDRYGVSLGHRLRNHPWVPAYGDPKFYTLYKSFNAGVCSVHNSAGVAASAESEVTPAPPPTEVRPEVSFDFHHTSSPQESPGGTPKPYIPDIDDFLVFSFQQEAGADTVPPPPILPPAELHAQVQAEVMIPGMSDVPPAPMETDTVTTATSVGPSGIIKRKLDTMWVRNQDGTFSQVPVLQFADAIANSISRKADWPSIEGVAEASVAAFKADETFAKLNQLTDTVTGISASYKADVEKLGNSFLREVQTDREQFFQQLEDTRRKSQMDLDDTKFQITNIARHGFYQTQSMVRSQLINAMRQVGKDITLPILKYPEFGVAPSEVAKAPTAPVGTQTVEQEVATQFQTFPTQDVGHWQPPVVAQSIAEEAQRLERTERAAELAEAHGSPAVTPPQPPFWLPSAGGGAWERAQDVDVDMTPPEHPGVGAPPSIAGYSGSLPRTPVVHLGTSDAPTPPPIAGGVPGGLPPKEKDILTQRAVAIIRQLGTYVLKANMPAVRHVVAGLDKLKLLSLLWEVLKEPRLYHQRSPEEQRGLKAGAKLLLDKVPEQVAVLVLGQMAATVNNQISHSPMRGKTVGVMYKLYGRWLVDTATMTNIHHGQFHKYRIAPQNWPTSLPVAGDTIVTGGPCVETQQWLVDRLRNISTGVLRLRLFRGVKATATSVAAYKRWWISFAPNITGETSTDSSGGSGSAGGAAGTAAGSASTSHTSRDTSTSTRRGSRGGSARGRSATARGGGGKKATFAHQSGDVLLDSVTSSGNTPLGESTMTSGDTDIPPPLYASTTGTTDTEMADTSGGQAVSDVGGVGAQKTATKIHVTITTTGEAMDTGEDTGATGRSTDESLARLGASSDVIALDSTATTSSGEPSADSAATLATRKYQRFLAFKERRKEKERRDRQLRAVSTGITSARGGKTPGGVVKPKAGGTSAQVGAGSGSRGRKGHKSETRQAPTKGQTEAADSKRTSLARSDALYLPALTAAQHGAIGQMATGTEMGGTSGDRAATSSSSATTGVTRHGGLLPTPPSSDAAKRQAAEWVAERHRLEEYQATLLEEMAAAEREAKKERTGPVDLDASDYDEQRIEHLTTEHKKRARASDAGSRADSTIPAGKRLDGRPSTTSTLASSVLNITTEDLPPQSDTNKPVTPTGGENFTREQMEKLQRQQRLELLAEQRQMVEDMERALREAKLEPAQPAPQAEQPTTTTTTTPTFQVVVPPLPQEEHADEEEQMTTEEVALSDDDGQHDQDEEAAAGSGPVAEKENGKSGGTSGR